MLPSLAGPPGSLEPDVKGHVPYYWCIKIALFLWASSSLILLLVLCLLLLVMSEALCKEMG